jgi:hypothetical protein
MDRENTQNNAKQNNEGAERPLRSLHRRVSCARGASPTERASPAITTATAAAVTTATTAATATATAATAAAASTPTEAAATTAAASTPTEPAAATAATAAGALTRLVHGEGAAVEIFAMKSTDGGLRLLLSSDLDEAESAGLTGHAIRHHLDADRLDAGALEGAPDGVLRRVEGQVANIQSLCHRLLTCTG